MHYIAGIHLSHNQGIEAIAVGSTILTIASLGSNLFKPLFFTPYILTVWTVRKQRKWFSKSNDEGGKVTTKLTTLAERLVTPIHQYAIAVAPLSYLAAVFSNKLEQPEWYTVTSLSQVVTMDVSVGTLAWIRTAAAVGFLGMVWCHEIILKELGKQFHFIGVC